MPDRDPNSAPETPPTPRDDASAAAIIANQAETVSPGGGALGGDAAAAAAVSLAMANGPMPGEPGLLGTEAGLAAAEARKEATEDRG